MAQFFQHFVYGLIEFIRRLCGRRMLLAREFPRQIGLVHRAQS
jgi:hypothetical protein